MFELKGYTHYINGTVGHDFKLTLLEKIKILFSKKLSVVFISANKKSYTQGNVDNMYEALIGLTKFTHSFCMNCKETEEKGDLVFRCNECPFCSELGTCYVKEFASKYGTEEQKRRVSCMER